MRKKNIVIIILFICSICNAQITRIVYKNGIYGQNLDSIKLDKEKFKDIPQEKIALLELFFKNQSNIEFELIYDKSSSFYQKKEFMPSDQNKIDEMNSLIDNKKYFKNNDSKEKIYQTTLDNLYNVIVPFEEYKWTISNETKIINGYKCYKATSIKEDIFNPYKQSKAIFYPEVWFTPEIPSSFGPQGLDGLPGLVLEATVNGKKYLYATKIEFNIKNVDKIEKFKKGKTITSVDLEKIIIDNYKKNLEN